jgi:Putative peptidoglycan binding domain
LETSNSEIFQVSARSQGAKPDSEGVRLTQVRLKDAGFDPGPIDGRRGAKTTAALLRFQAGCTMLKNLPPTWDQQFRAGDKPSSRSMEKKANPRQRNRP